MTPRVIAMDAPRAPWVIEIERRFRAEGFRVLRTASRTRVIRTEGAQAETFDRAETRYVLFVDGAAPLDPMRRCFGGGFRFDFITVELVDTLNNETLISISDSGYSENCPPTISSLFGNIIRNIAGMWKE